MDEETVDPPQLLNRAKQLSANMFQFVFGASYMPDGRGPPQETVQRLPENNLTIRETFRKDNLVFFSVMDDLVDAMCGLIGFTPPI